MLGPRAYGTKKDLLRDIKDRLCSIANFVCGPEKPTFSPASAGNSSVASLWLYPDPSAVYLLWHPDPMS